MDGSRIFYEYTGNVLAPQLGKQCKVPSYPFHQWTPHPLTYQLNELCSDLSIVLIYLYPNATRLFQPLNVASFRPQKIGWKTAVLEWHRQNSDKILHQECFTPVLNGALKKYALQCSATRFLTLWLIPWDPENTDFSKYLGKS
jgi:hypothetical protein